MLTIIDTVAALYASYRGACQTNWCEAPPLLTLLHWIRHTSNAHVSGESESETWFAQSEIERDQIVVCLVIYLSVFDLINRFFCMRSVQANVRVRSRPYDSIFLKENMLGKMDCVSS